MDKDTLDEALDGLIKHLRRNQELIEREEAIFCSRPLPRCEERCGGKETIKEKAPKIKPDDKERWQWRDIKEYGWPKSGSTVEFYMPRDRKGEKWVQACEFWEHVLTPYREPYTVDDIKESIKLRSSGAIYWCYLDLPDEGQQHLNFGKIEERD